MKKRMIIILGIFTFAIIIFKVFISPLNIKLEIPYNNPIYRLQLNDDYYGMNMEINYNINIIPQNFTFIKTAHVYTYPSKITVKLGDEMSLNITAYNCFLKSNNKLNKIGCTNYNHQIMKEIKNLKFTKMKITGGSETGLVNDLVYNGNYTNELNNLITEKGLYQIEIMLEHKPITSSLIFIIEVID